MDYSIKTTDALVSGDCYSQLMTILIVLTHVICGIQGTTTWLSTVKHLIEAAPW